MKKAFILMFTCILLTALLCTLSLTAQADEQPSLVFSSVKAAPGSTVTITATFSGNPGITAGRWKLIIDPALTMTSMEYNIPEGEGIPPQNMTAANLYFVWHLDVKDSDYNGVFVTMTFTVSENVEDGYVASVSAVTDEVFNLADQDVAFEIVSGGVTIDPTAVEASSIKCAEVALGIDISVNYYADLKSGDEDAQMRFTMHGTETVVDGTLDDSGLYVFPFTGVTPQALGDNIKAELILDGKVLDTKDGYSVLQNCKNLLGKSPDTLGLTSGQYEAMRTLIADLMEYGAAAQTYRGYNTNALVNQDVVIASLTPTEFVPLKDTDDLPVSSSLDPEDSGDNAFTAAGVLFDYQNSLYVRFKTADTVTAPQITVSSDYYDGGTYDEDSFILCDDGSYLFILDPMTADFMSFDAAEGCYIEYEIMLRIKSGTRYKTAQTLIYSLASYVYAVQDQNSNMSALAKAVYNYGLSAAAYKNAV